MNEDRWIGVYRESIFSPGKVEDDAAILNVLGFCSINDPITV